MKKILLLLLGLAGAEAARAQTQNVRLSDLVSASMGSASTAFDNFLRAVQTVGIGVGGVVIVAVVCYAGIRLASSSTADGGHNSENAATFTRTMIFALVGGGTVMSAGLIAKLFLSFF